MDLKIKKSDSKIVQILTLYSNLIRSRSDLFLIRSHVLMSGFSILVDWVVFTHSLQVDFLKISYRQDGLVVITNKISNKSCKSDLTGIFRNYIEATELK